MIPEKTTNKKREELLTDYDNHMSSYDSQFSVSRTWFDENAQVDAIFASSMEDGC